MDQSRTGPNGHVQQHNEHGNTFHNFLDGHQNFAEDAFGATEDSGPATDYDLSWNSELFLQPPPTYPHHSPSPGPAFDHSNRQHQSPTPNYGGIQSTLSPSPFSQNQAYENPALPQQSYEPRSVSRVLPSPSYSFQPTSYDQNQNYPGRDQMLSSSHFQRPVSNASMMLGAHQQPRLSPTMAGTYAAQTNTSTYQSMDPRQMHRPGYQSSELGHFPVFNEHSQQPASQFISPQMLTASNMRAGGAGYQQHLQGQPGHHVSGSASPYVNSLYSTDPRMYQSPQSFQQSIAPAHAIQAAQSRAGAAAPSTSTFQGVVVPPKIIKPKVPKDANAPKRSRKRPQNDGMIQKVKKYGEASSSEESESEDELQVEEEEPEMTPAPLTLARPMELRARAVYDAVHAIWSPRNLPAKPETVKSGGQLYSDTIRKLRDAWKPENEALTAAENANNAAKVAVLKETVEAYRDTLKKILDRTHLYGHPAHLRHVPLYPYTLSAFNSFLVDRIKRDDYEAPLVTSMMKTFIRFDTMTEEQLEQSKLIKLIQRISKKSNAETRALAQKVLDNAAAASKAAKSKQQHDVASPSSPKAPNGSLSVSARPTSLSGLAPKTEVVAGVKRPLEDESAASPVTKRASSKPIVQASKPLAVQQAERRKAEMAKQKAAKGVKPIVNGAPTAPAPQPKVIAAPARPVPSGAFAGLLSASKKPGTSIAEKAAAAKAKPPVAPSTKKDSSLPPAPAPVKPAFSFLDALQGMDKPREVEKKEEVRPNETPEERRKRLRKEERGKLRVSWADRLTDVRLFTHDPEEEIGHDNNMKRDVDDVGGEGRMLKMHFGEHDLEDDEGEELDSYDSPSEVDFSELDWEERKGHFVKTGGPEMPESRSSEAQRLHEDSSIMVVYALPSDQPSSPKEPPETEDDYEPDLATSFGEPPELVREREKRWLAQRPQESQAPAANGTFDINSLLRSMQQPQAAQQASIPMDVQRTLALLGQQQQQQQQQPPQPVAQPQAPPLPNLSSILAVVNQMKGIQQPPHQQMQPIPQPVPPQPTGVPIMQPNVAAIMQALQAQNAQQSQSLPVGSHNNPNPYPGSVSFDDLSRKHARNEASAADDGSENGRKGNKKKKGSNGALAEVPYNYKTMVCSFWQKGMCTKGDNCTYRHSD